MGGDDPRRAGPDVGVRMRSWWRRVTDPQWDPTDIPDLGAPPLPAGRVVLAVAADDAMRGVLGTHLAEPGWVVLNAGQELSPSPESWAAAVEAVTRAEVPFDVVIDRVEVKESANIVVLPVGDGVARLRSRLLARLIEEGVFGASAVRSEPRLGFIVRGAWSTAPSRAELHDEAARVRPLLPIGLRVRQLDAYAETAVAHRRVMTFRFEGR
jgi:hypothetical protein